MPLRSPRLVRFTGNIIILKYLIWLCYTDISDLKQNSLQLHTQTSKAKHLTTPAGDALAQAQLLEKYGNLRVQRLSASVVEGKLHL
jgi:hypothetical protein